MLLRDRAAKQIELANEAALSLLSLADDTWSVSSDEDESAI